VLRHVALFRWKPETTAAEVNLIRPILAKREANEYVIDPSD
jgi:hypothetical protein